MIRFKRLPRFPSALARRVSVAALSMVLEYIPIEAKIMCGDAIRLDSQQVLNLAAAQNNTDAFTRLNGNRREAAEYAIRADHVEILQLCFLHKHQLELAARYGAMRCFKYLWANCVGNLPLASMEAAGYNSVEILRYIYTLPGFVAPYDIMAHATYYDNVEAVRYLETRGVEIDDWVITTSIALLDGYNENVATRSVCRLAMQRDRLDVLEWLCKNTPMLPNAILLEAVKKDYIPAVQFALAYGAEYDSDMVYHAMVNESTHCFELMRGKVHIDYNMWFTHAAASNNIQMLWILKPHVKLVHINAAFAAARDIRILILLRRWGANVYHSKNTQTRIRMLLAIWRSKIGAPILVI